MEEVKAVPAGNQGGVSDQDADHQFAEHGGHADPFEQIAANFRQQQNDDNRQQDVCDRIDMTTGMVVVAFGVRFVCGMQFVSGVLSRRVRVRLGMCFGGGVFGIGLSEGEIRGAQADCARRPKAG